MLLRKNPLSFFPLKNISSVGRLSYIPIIQNKCANERPLLAAQDWTLLLPERISHQDEVPLTREEPPPPPSPHGTVNESSAAVRKKITGRNKNQMRKSDEKIKTKM